MAQQPSRRDAAAAAAAADFGRTRWSIVAAVRDGSEDAARASLAELCRRYWVPVYAYVRRCGHPPDGAGALVQAFLGHLVREIRADDPASAGSFRDFLQRRLAAFLASDWTELEPPPPGEFAPPSPIAEIEQRQRRGQPDRATPEDAFQRAFALELLAVGLDRLRSEAAAAGRSTLFDTVRPYLARDPGPGEYDRLAAQLGATPLGTAIAIKRLRRRYQEIVDALLRETVGGADALDAERANLLANVGSAAAR